MQRGNLLVYGMLEKELKMKLVRIIMSSVVVISWFLSVIGVIYIISSPPGSGFLYNAMVPIFIISTVCLLLIGESIEGEV